MKKLILITILFAFSVALFTVPAFAVSSNAAVKGEAEDPSNPWLGVITYLGNYPGYQFWFTSQANWDGFYIAGHSYHNVYKVQVDDPSEWCGITHVPDRPPYNLVGHTGENVYYKVFDLTAGVEVCPFR